jgi:hypothetical protein
MPHIEISFRARRAVFFRYPCSSRPHGLDGAVKSFDLDAHLSNGNKSERVERSSGERRIIEFSNNNVCAWLCLLTDF